MINDHLDEELLKKRIIFLYYGICDEIAEEVNKKLLLLNSQKIAPIQLIINSPGGDIPAGLSIIDTMNMIGSPITTIISGRAESMAAYISINGATRYITTNSYWMIHDCYSSNANYLSKIKSHTCHLEKLNTNLDNMIINKTKLSKNEIQLSINKDLYLLAEDCITKGVADNIIKGIGFTHGNDKTRSRK